MATVRFRSRFSDVDGSDTTVATIPNPEQVLAAAAEIRRHWSPRERRRRAEIAHRMLAGHWFAPRADVAQRAILPLRPTCRLWR